jgi:adenine-specific DNA-methyltransferase
MARRKTLEATRNGKRTVDYRYPHEKRTNIPLGRIAGEGTVPKVPKVRYFYSPHLPPTLQFDPTGGPDKLNELLDKVTRVQLSASEAGQLRDALRRQEPWLEWSGKREKPWFEVDPVALQMHERVSTQAILRVLAREDVERDLFADPQQDYAKAVQFYQHDVNWANRMILGDSLQVMASLARRERLAGKVQMIYLDPPYGIKFASNFQPQFGQRDVKDRDQDLTREPEMVKAYRDTWTLGIHSYLAYLRDRLTMARELLADSGSLFVQISDENLHRVRCVMDEVFGKDNFIVTIVVKKKSTTTPTDPVCDYLLWFVKDRAKLKLNRLFQQKLTPDDDPKFNTLILPSGEMQRVGNLADEEVAKLIGNGAKWARVNYPLVSQDPSERSKDFAFHGKSFSCGKNRHWTYDLEVGMPRLEKSERIFDGGGESLGAVVYWNDWSHSARSNVWDDVHGEPNPIYVVQTSYKVIERCLLMTTDPGDLVLDPTCGSGTTAYVAEQWGRRWITCDSSRVALSLAKHRLMTAKFDYYQLRPLSAKDVSRNPHGTWLTDPMGKVPGKATFRCKTVPHVTLKSIAGDTSLDPIFAKHEPILAGLLEKLNREVDKVGTTLKEKLVEKLIHKHREEGTSAVTDADMRRWLLPNTQPALIKSIAARKPLKGVTPKQAENYRDSIPKGGWKEWEVPFDTDPDWPKLLQDALTSYRAAWRAKMDEVNPCISANAEMEELVDKPEPVKGVVRVSGPYTIEGVRPEELNLADDDLVDDPPNEFEDEEGASLTAINQQNLQAYLCHRQWETDPPGTLNLTHRFRWFLHEGGADAEGGGADGIGGFEEARG